MLTKVTKVWLEGDHDETSGALSEDDALADIWKTVSQARSTDDEILPLPSQRRQQQASTLRPGPQEKDPKAHLVLG